MEARPARFCSLCLVPSKRCLRNKQSYYTIATTYNKDMSNKSLVVKMPLLSGLMNRRPILYVYTEAASLPKCIAKCVRCAGENRVRSVYSFFVQFKVVPGWVECCGRWPSTWRRGPGINNVVTTTTMPTQDRHLINHTRAILSRRYTWGGPDETLSRWQCYDTGTYCVTCWGKFGYRACSLVHIIWNQLP